MYQKQTTYWFHIDKGETVSQINISNDGSKWVHVQADYNEDLSHTFVFNDGKWEYEDPEDPPTYDEEWYEAVLNYLNTNKHPEL